MKKVLLNLAIIALVKSTLLGGSIELRLGPGGAAELFNSSADYVLLDSYEISGSLLSPGAWDSLSAQGFSFAQTSATSTLLAEAATAGGLLFAPSQSRSIGFPFNAPDLNGDGSVGLADFLIFSANFNQPATRGIRDGDINGDGIVDFADFVIFAANVGTTFDPTISYSFSAKEHSPETRVPDQGSSIMLLGLACIGVMALRRKLSAA